MTTSAGDLINGSLRLIGMLAEAEVPSAATSQDALSAMNQMIESWNTERLAVFSTQDQVFTWPVNTISQTLGPTGDFVGNRPISLDDSTYFKSSQGLSYGIQIINQEQYDGIALKTVTSSYPMVIFINSDFPNISMFVYPVPTQALEWHFISVTELSEPANLASALTFPPGYLRAFRFNLACELGAEFGVEPSTQVKRIAMTSKRDLKRINNPGDIMSMPASIMRNGSSRFNIYTGSLG